MNNEQNKSINLASGLLSGMITAGIYHPIDSLRMRSFLNPSTMGTIKSLKNGLAFNITSTGLKNIIVFPLREQVRDYTITSKTQPTVYQEISASIISGCLLASINTPINIIKIRMQNNIGTHEPFLNIVKDTNGIRNYYKGGIATLLRDITFNCVYFPVYNSIEKSTDHKIVSSIVSGIIATTLSYPFDGMRLFMQSKRSIEFNVWIGLKKSFEFSSANAKSYLYAIIRVPLANCTAHMSYLYIKDILSKV